MVHGHSLPDRVSFVTHTVAVADVSFIISIASTATEGVSVTPCRYSIAFSSRFDARNSMVRRDSGVANVKASAYL